MGMAYFGMVITGKKADIQRAIELLKTDNKLMFKSKNPPLISIFERKDVFPYVPNDYDKIDGTTETRLVFRNDYKDNGTFENREILAQAIPEIELFYRDNVIYQILYQ